MAKVKPDPRPVDNIFASRFLDLFGVSPAELPRLQSLSASPVARSSESPLDSSSWENRSAKIATLMLNREKTLLNKSISPDDPQQREILNSLELAYKRCKETLNISKSLQHQQESHGSSLSLSQDSSCSDTVSEPLENMNTSDAMRMRTTDELTSPNSSKSHNVTLNTSYIYSQNEYCLEIQKVFNEFIPGQKTEEGKLSVWSENDTPANENADLQKISQPPSSPLQCVKSELSPRSQADQDDFLSEYSTKSRSSLEVDTRLAMLAHLPVALSIGSWTRYQDERGKPYYHNPEEEKTQWEIPKEFNINLQDWRIYYLKLMNQRLKKENDILHQQQETLWNEIDHLKASVEKLLKNHVQIMMENSRLHRWQNRCRDRDCIKISETALRKKVARDLSSKKSFEEEMVVEEHGVLDSSQYPYGDSNHFVNYMKPEKEKSKILGVNNKRVVRFIAQTKKSPEKRRKIKKNGLKDKADSKQLHHAKQVDERSKGMEKTMKRNAQPHNFAKRILSRPVFRKRRRFVVTCKYGRSCKYKNCKFSHPKNVKSKRSLPKFSELNHECGQCGEKFRFRESLRYHEQKHLQRSASTKNKSHTKSREKEEQLDVKLSKVKEAVVGKGDNDPETSVEERVPAKEEETERRSKRRRKERSR